MPKVKVEELQPSILALAPGKYTTQQIASAITRPQPQLQLDGTEPSSASWLASVACVLDCLARRNDGVEHIRPKHWRIT